MVLFNSSTEKNPERAQKSVLPVSVGSHPENFINGCLFVGNDRNLIWAQVRNEKCAPWLNIAIKDFKGHGFEMKHRSLSRMFDIKLWSHGKAIRSPFLGFKGSIYLYLKNKEKASLNCRFLDYLSFGQHVKALKRLIWQHSIMAEGVSLLCFVSVHQSCKHMAMLSVILMSHEGEEGCIYLRKRRLDGRSSCKYLEVPNTYLQSISTKIRQMNPIKLAPAKLSCLAVPAVCLVPR